MRQRRRKEDESAATARHGRTRNEAEEAEACLRMTTAYRTCVQEERVIQLPGLHGTGIETLSTKENYARGTGDGGMAGPADRLLSFHFDSFPDPRA